MYEVYKTKVLVLYIALSAYNFAGVGIVSLSTKNRFSKKFDYLIISVSLLIRAKVEC
jgi:hypothetical protein